MTSLKKNIFYSGILTTANYIFPLITYPYVSRVLGVANIGVCNFVDSIINYFLILSALGIRTVGIRFGFKPRTSLCEGLRKFAEWYKEFYG